MIWVFMSVTRTQVIGACHMCGTTRTVAVYRYEQSHSWKRVGSFKSIRKARKWIKQWGMEDVLYRIVDELDTVVNNAGELLTFDWDS